MARKRRTPDAPTLTTAESTARATAARVRVITRREQRERLSFVEREVARDAPHHDIVAACRDRFSMSEAAVERVKTKVFAQWTRAEAELRSSRRSMARRRIMGLVGAAVTSGNLKAALAAETLLAKIDGFFAEGTERVAVTVETHRCGPVCRVVGALSAEETDELVAESEATERDAALWRARPLSAAV